MRPSAAYRRAFQAAHQDGPAAVSWDVYRLDLRGELIAGARSERAARELVAAIDACTTADEAATATRRWHAARQETRP